MNPDPTASIYILNELIRLSVLSCIRSVKKMFHYTFYTELHFTNITFTIIREPPITPVTPVIIAWVYI